MAPVVFILVIIFNLAALPYSPLCQAGLYQVSFSNLTQYFFALSDTWNKCVISKLHTPDARTVPCSIL